MASNSLKDICYEPIAPGFSYGMFGDFKLIVDTDTGFFNATKLCAAGGRKFKKWLGNKQTKDFLEYLNRQYDEPLLYVRTGKTDPVNVMLRGTYVSRRLITCIACWISPVFADKANEIVCDYFEKQFKEKCARDEIRIAELQHENENLASKLEKYEKVEEDISPKAFDPRKRHVFVLVETNGVYPFYAIRCQSASKSGQIKKLRRKYPDLTEVFEIAYDPNSINLFNRAKENIKDITTFCNGIMLLNGYTKENFERDLRKIAEEKL